MFNVFLAQTSFSELFHEMLSFKNVDWNEVIKATNETVYMSFLSTFYVFIIGLALGLFLYLTSPGRSLENKWVNLFLSGIINIFRSVPFIILLALLMPFTKALMGTILGPKGAIPTLVISAAPFYARLVSISLNEIPSGVVEAAESMGATTRQIITKVLIPESLPALVSGITVTTIALVGSTAVAGVIGAGGLGSFILLGIDRNNSSLILIGAISAAILAILFNFLLKWMETAKLRTILAAFVVLIIGLGTSYAPTIAKMQTSDKLVIAGKLGPEPEILMNMYKLLIEDQTNLKVEVKPNFGKTNFLYEALKKGDIDIYPEFSGTITESLLKNKPKVSHEPEEVYEVARKGILEQDGFVFLKPMAYQNTYAVAVPKSLAESENLTKISDLKKVNHPLKAGFTLEFNDREDGNKGLQSMYGLQLDVATMEPALRYQAIQSGDIQVTDAYSTDAEISRYQLKVLEDDKQLFPPYQGAPLMKQELLKKHPELEGILNQLAGKISEEEMSQMNFEVGANGRPAEEVAREYLVKVNLLKH